MGNHPQQETVRLQNIYQAAYCMCRGLKVAGLDRSASKVTIIFAGKDAQTKALEFYNGARVEAKAYSDSYRSLKDLIFER